MHRFHGEVLPRLRERDLRPPDPLVPLVHVKEDMAPTPKSLDECRGAAIAAYQDHLEKEWIMELQRKHRHKINREALYSLVRE